MLCAHLSRKIIGGNECDYRATAEVRQEIVAISKCEKQVYAISQEIVLLPGSLVAIFSRPQQKNAIVITSECLVLLSTDCLTSRFQSRANFSHATGLFWQQRMPSLPSLQLHSVVYARISGHGWSSETISLSDRSGSEAVNIFSGFIWLLGSTVLGVQQQTFRWENV